jgi:hypothetical protein
METQTAGKRKRKQAPPQESESEEDQESESEEDQESESEEDQESEEEEEEEEEVAAPPKRSNKGKQTVGASGHAHVDCMVCCQGMRPSVRPPVECPACSFTACTLCCQRYLVESQAMDPRCMNPECDVAWSMDFVIDTFPRTFLANDLKKAREQMLVHVEKSLLPQSQPFAARQTNLEDLKAHQKELNQELSAAFGIYRALKDRRDDVLFRVRAIEQWQDDPGEGASQRLNDDDSNDDDDLRATQRAAALSSRNQVSVHVMGCPVEDCRGSIRGDTFQCGMCSQKVCKGCMVTMGKDTSHKCKPEDKASAKLIRKDSKPCPHCSAPIHKIEGCNDMFCTKCHVSFNWRTLQVHTRPGHNPHMFEWLQRNQTAAAAAAVQGGAAAAPAGQQARCTHAPPDPRRGRIGTVLAGLSKEIILSCIRMHNHLQEEVMAMPTMREARQFRQIGRALSTLERRSKLQHRGTVAAAVANAVYRGGDAAVATDIAEDERITEDPTGNLDVRIRFLRGEIDEERFGQLLQQRDRRIRRLSGWHEVLEVFLVGLRDLLWNLEEFQVAKPPRGTSNDRAWLVKQMEEEAFPIFEQELTTLVEFCNQGFMATAKRYGTGKNHPVVTIYGSDIKTSELPSRQSAHRHARAQRCERACLSIPSGIAGTAREN